jgi:hypothetical protein
MMALLGARLAISALAVATLAACDTKPVATQEQLPATDPSIVGRWCFKPGALPQLWQILEIHRTLGGYELRQIANDGSRRTVELVRSGNSYSEVESATGDKYDVDTATASLLVGDGEGLIGTADKLSDVSQPTDCQA